MTRNNLFILESLLFVSNTKSLIIIVPIYLLTYVLIETE